MAERYKSLGKHIETSYICDCPISLEAYNILRDLKERKTLAQLKLKNCTLRVISGVVVSIKAYDQLGEFIEEIKEYHYTNIKVLPGEEFGSKTPVYFSGNISAQTIEIFVNAVLFADETVWKQEEPESFVPLASASALSSLIQDSELRQEYKRITCGEASCVPERIGEQMWRCTCGSLNIGESCCKCHVSQNQVFDFLNLEKLEESLHGEEYTKAKAALSSTDTEELKKAEEVFKKLGIYKDSEKMINECQDRIALLEKKEQEQIEEKQRQLIEKSNKKKKQLIRDVGLTAAIICVILLITQIIMPNQRYKEANALFDNGEYEDAIVIYEELGNYRDSKDKVSEAQKIMCYNAGLSALEKKDYEEAIRQLKKASPYKDSQQKLEKAKAEYEEYQKEEKYQEVLTALKNRDYEGRTSNSIDSILEELGDYKDSPIILKELQEYENTLRKFISDEPQYKGREYFVDALDLIKNGKYVSFEDEEEVFYNFMGLVTGKWVFSSGDDQLLSYTTKDAARHKSIKNIEIKYAETRDRFTSLQVFNLESSTFGGLFVSMSVDFDSQSFTNGSYKSGKFKFWLKDENTLHIEFYGKSGMPELVTAEYKRVE